MLVGSGAGFEEEAVFFGFVRAAGQGLGVVVVLVTAVVGVIGWVGAVEDFAIFGEFLFVVVRDFFRGVVRLQFQNR